MKTSNGDWHDWRVALFVHSIVTSLIRGSLIWDDEKAWSDLEMGYNEIKNG